MYRNNLCVSHSFDYFRLEAFFEYYDGIFYHCLQMYNKIT